MAYNKSKYVEAAQKLLNQGKVAQAIAEYQNILKYEPRDQVTLMTIGELYIRQGETFQAIDYFERLAQIFVGDGFLTKAIAVYKRIAKLAPEEIRPLEKLADLYVQQGVMSEARPLFLQLAEIHLKNNRQTEAIGLLKKLLQAEPDNLRIQIRLADLYQAMGQPRDAIEAYVSASQRALARGDHAESEKLADKALKLEPNNAAALIVRARSYSSQGDLTKAAQLLQQVPDLEKGGEQTELLLDFHLKNSSWDQAVTLAVQVFEADAKNYGPLQKVVEALLEAGQTQKAMGILEQSRIAMIDAGEHEVVAKMLHDLAARMPGRLEPLQWLVELYGRTSDSFRMPDALTNLGDAFVADEQYEEAKKIFEQLVERQPESDAAKRKLNGVLRKMGLLAPGAELEEPEPPREDLKADIPKVPTPKLRTDVSDFGPEFGAKQPKPAGAATEQQLDDETQQFITQSLTDVDLFASYGLTQKAIGLLEAILRRAPRHTPTLEKLLDFVLGAGDDRRTAELAAQLEKIHTETGDTRNAERFAELRRRFQRAAGISDEELAGAVAPTPPAAPQAAPEEPAEMAIPEVTATALPAEEPAAPAPVSSAPAPAAAEPQPEPVEANSASTEEEVQEVDLSDEWATLLEESHQPPPKVEAPAPPPPPPKTPAPPARVEQPAHIEEFAVHEEPAPVAADDAPAAAAPPIPLEKPAAKVPADKSAAGKPKEKPATKVPAKPPKPAEPELELEQEYELVLEQEPLVPAYDQKPPQTPAARPPQAVAQNKSAAPPADAGFESDQFLADLAKEIDQLGLDSLVPPPSNSKASAPAPPKAKQQAPAPAAEPPSGGESGPLKEVFDEFRAELGEMGAEDEDLETHYNLGIAFREMGLLEEAISEFQKVAKASDRGRAFRYTMQCCTLLGLAFMEKGQPAIAAIWYERALLTPGMDPESTLALRYDLGVAQESAGEPDAALKSFSQVYAMNIDYRDVAERIAALQKPIR
jgi:tetratricopeptide (TPR) repeat protein